MSLESGGILVSVVSVVVGVLLGAAGIFVAFGLHVVRDLGRLREQLRDMRGIVGSARRGHPSLDGALIGTSISRETKFWGKLFTRRKEKIDIAEKIALDIIEEGDIILLDSGTTVDQIAPILRDCGKSVDIYTNNLLVAMSMLPPTKEIPCVLLGGIIDPEYGATYDLDDISKPLAGLSPSKIILAARAISVAEGPLVSVKDDGNLQFKRKLVQMALNDRMSRTRLIVAADWSKLVPQTETEDGVRLQAVLSVADWDACKATEQFTLVTTEPPENLAGPESQQARKALRKLQKCSMEVLIASDVTPS